MQAATKAGNGGEHHNPQREFGKRRQVADEAKDVRAHSTLSFRTESIASENVHLRS
jgi:hypothetical protein